jgi:hypothetical protein
MRFCTASTYTVLLGYDLELTEASEYYIIYYFVNPLGVMTIPTFTLSYINPDSSVVSYKSSGLTWTTTAGTCTVS